MKIIIVDFDDSFTFNIASVLFKYESSIKVISHEDFFKINFKELFTDKIAIVLGPGPGHPKNYQKYFLKINELKSMKNVYLLGICLGHQIIGLVDGFCVKKALNPKHGEQEVIKFKNKLFKVQRYNSLAVFKGDLEINIRVLANGITYQFHPESIGTEKNIYFFNELLKFIN